MPEARERLSRTEIAMRVRGLVAEQLREPLEAVSEGATLWTLCHDEVAAIFLLTAIKDVFGVSFDGEIFSHETTVGRLIDLVEGGIARE